MVQQNCFCDIQIQVLSLELLPTYKTIQVRASISMKCIKRKMLWKQYFLFSVISTCQITISNTKRKETDQETMNFLPILFSFEFNDFHDYKVLINSFPVYVFSILQLLTFLPFACLVIRRTMKFFFIYTTQVYK